MTKMIRVIGEVHHQETDDEKFKEFAENLAEQGKVTLVLENYIIEGHKYKKNPALTGENVLPIEDKIIWEYCDVVLAIFESYLLIRTMEKEEDAEENIYKYLDYYFSFLRNIENENPLIGILQKIRNENYDDDRFKNFFQIFLNKHEFYRKKQEEQESRIESILGEKDKLGNYMKDADKNLIKNNIKYFNAILQEAALGIIKLLSGELSRYSEKIRGHNGVSEKWINDYFELASSSKFKSTEEYEELEDFLYEQSDTVIVDLRNQWFVERLNVIASENGNKETWFIVGEAHLKGIEELFKEQYPSTDFAIIPREERYELMNRYLASGEHQEDEEDEGCQSVYRCLR